jgi:MFS family permease
MKLKTEEIQFLTEYVDQIEAASITDLRYPPDEIRKNLFEINNRASNGYSVVNIKIPQFFLDDEIKRDIPRPLHEKLVNISKQYNEGADWVGSLFGIYNGIAALAALLLPLLARYTSRKVTHLIALCCGGVGLISFYFINDPDVLLLSMVGVGVAWASILSIPYAMLSGSLPSEKMGYYMGVFNFFIVIPQIIASTVLGFMLRYFFNNQSIFILVGGGISMIVAGLLSLRVDDKDEVLIKEKV